jgi:transglutaminase-like putative cysteine protease
MTMTMADRHRLAGLGCLATVATSLSLFPAFQEKRYLVIGAGLSLVVLGVGMLWRQLHLPALLAPIVQAVVVGELLLATYGHHLTYGVVPTSATFQAVDAKISSGIDIAQRFAAPVPPSPGLTMITVAFVALVAIIVDLLAAGLSRATLAGLPLLALYTVPVASLPKGVPALGFIPGAAAYLGLLMVSERERLGHWGRHVSRASADHVHAIDTSALSAAGRRISVAAIATAVVLPVFIPGLSHQLFHGKSGGIGNSDGKPNFADPMVSLASALHLHTPVDLIDVNSAVAPSYLRLAVLSNPGPNAWTASGVTTSDTIPIDNVLPGPPGLSSQVATHPRSMSLTLAEGFPRGGPWLPVPYVATDIEVDLGFGAIPDDFAYVPNDQTVTATTGDALSHVQSYHVSYNRVSPTKQQLVDSTAVPPSIVAAYDRVPAGVPEVVRDDALSVTAHGVGPYQKALELQSFFRDSQQFTYDLNAGYGYGYRAMAKFLQARRGYCQHFAATMAMMARIVGIPSRVVVGFLSPSREEGNGTYVFTSHDAHAWPELYFGGVGWVRFEPTPGNGATIPSYTHQVAVPRVNRTPPQQTPGGTIGHASGDNPTTAASATTPRIRNKHRSNGGSVPPLTWLLMVLAVAVILAPGAIRWGVRRSRLARAIDGGASCEYAWLEVRDRVVDLRLPWSGSLTPRARRRFVEPLLGGDPDGVAALDRLSLTVERARYAGSPLAGAVPCDDARDILVALTASADRKRRVLAFFWPMSLMASLRSGWLAVGSRARLWRRPAA